MSWHCSSLSHSYTRLNRGTSKEDSSLYVNALFDQFIQIADPPNYPHTGINSQLFEFLDIEAKGRYQIEAVEKSPINNEDAAFCELLESRSGTLIFVGMQWCRGATHRIDDGYDGNSR